MAKYLISFPSAAMVVPYGAAAAGVYPWAPPLDGGFTESSAERLAYGVLGWFLTGKNLFLFVGLLTSAASRAHYADNGSFGLTNDMIRVAQDVLGWRLESVAFCGVLASLLVLPAALYLWRLSSAARAAD